MTVVFVGDISLDTTVVIDHVPVPDEKVVAASVTDCAGGVIPNAARAAHLAGAPARLICAVGDDATGPLVAGQMRALDIAVDARAVPGPTARALILVDQGGEKRLVLVRGVTMYPPLAAVRELDLTGCRWVHTAAYDLAAAIELARRCRLAGLPLSLDLEPATLPARIADLGPLIDGVAAVFCNSRAAAALGDAPAVLLGLGARRVVLTRGAAGVRVVSAAGSTPLVPVSLRQPVVDTTGAGDCLAGWFAARAALGDGFVAALREAVDAASLSCTRPGTQTSYPTRAEVLAISVSGSAGRGTDERIS